MVVVEATVEAAMPTKPSGFQLVPFSFTRLKDYERCPLYAYQVHVLKNRGPQSPAAGRGEAVHKEAENFVKAKVAGGKPVVPQAVRLYGEELRVAVKQKPQTELRFGVTAKWEPTDFFGKDVWGRGVWDLVILDPERLRVVDYKTGKMYPETMDQLRFYAAAALSVAPAAPKVTAEAWHVDQPYPQGKLVFELFPAEVKMVRRDFEARVVKMQDDKKLKPRSNAYCKYCHLRKSVGGPCTEGF